MIKQLKTILHSKGTYSSNDMEENYSELSAGKIKNAILHKTPFYYMKLFDLLEQKDTSIGSEVDKRKLSCENKFFTTSNTKYDESVEEIIKASVNARIFGISIIELYLDENSEFAFSFIPKEYYNFDEEKGLYLKSEKTKIYPKEPNFYIIKHIPVLLKTLWIAYAKHFVLSHYLKFAEFLGVPPLIVNAHSSDAQTISSIAMATKSLKSGDYAIFNENDIVKVLEGRGSQADFMEFVRYCDTEIAKVINGASLGSNISKNGSYSQSKTHEENRAEIVNSDIKFASRVATKLFKKIDIDINLNIAVQKDKELLDRARTLEILKNLGYEMSASQLAYEFDLPNPTKEKTSQEQEINKNVSINSKLAKDSIDLVLEDNYFQDELKQSEDEILILLKQLLNECKSYEDVYEKISINFNNIEFKKLEELLFKAIAQSQIKGSL